MDANEKQKHPITLKSTVMKKLFILAAVIATSFIATTGYSQVYVNARVGFGHVGVGFPIVHRPFVPVPEPVVYGGGYGVYAPAPVYYGHYRPVIMRDRRFDRRFDHRGRW